MRILATLLLGSLAVLALACAGSEPDPTLTSTPSLTPTQTPDKAATVEAGIAATAEAEASIDANAAAAVPTPTSTPTPAPTPTPTPRPTLPPLQPDFASLMNDSREPWGVRERIDELGRRMPELAKKIEDLPWVKDGIEWRREGAAVNALIRLADAGYTERLIEEPWVIEGRNYAALMELQHLSWDPETLDGIMSHPAISDGIADQEAKVLATLGTTAYPVEQHLKDHNLLDKLLDPEQVILEEQTITLPLAGATELALIRTSPGDVRTMDFVKRSVRSIEEFMGIPFPRREVIFLFVEAPGGGKNFDSHVQIRTDEQDIDRFSGGADSWLSIIAHETAHYYWRGSPTWLSEGAARFMEAVVADRLHISTDGILTGLIQTRHKPCTLVQTIAELEALDPPVPKTFEYYDCEYLLGTALLHDLYHNMDEITFRQAFRRLFAHTQFIRECDGEDVVNICHVKEAFRTYVSEEQWPAVEEVFTRRYGAH